MAGVARAVLYQLQRLDAFLLDVLYQNVRRMQDRVLPAASSRDGEIRRHNANYPEELLSWTADGFRKMHLDDASDLVALQIAPWTFITSPYAYSLIIMAILLNRIQHVVVPTHDPQAGRLNSWLSKLLPIDASATQTRFLLRSASLYLLWKSLLLMGAILLQAFGMFPDIPLLESLRQRASTTNMVDVCWSSFVAICVAMAISTFTRGLDGSGPPISSFNLPQYAFVLHLYSSPLGTVFNRLADTYQGQAPALRPNRHVLVTLFLPLLHMTMIHTQGIWKRYHKDVLIPSSICGLLGLTHFIYTLSIGQIMEYPLLQVVPSSLELFLFAMILCTTGLNALSQILLQGKVIRPLFGPGAGALPSWDEEYAVALVRLGTSSVDATSAAGLGNEVARLSSKSFQEGTIRLGPSGVTLFKPPSQKSSRKTKVENPFSLEIKHVRAVSAEGDMWINIMWMKEVARFAVSLWRFMRGVGIMIRGRRVDDGIASNSISQLSSPVDRGAAVTSRHSDVYQRFLADEAISDHGSDFGDQSTTGTTSDATDDVEDDPSTESESGHADEASQLYSDHAYQRASTPLTPVLLAHLTTPSGSPLTRRRYSSLLLPRDAEEDIRVETPSRNTPSSINRTHIMSQGSRGELDAERKMCVICMCSDRVVVCWPCRCLSMCDECRSNLASRNGPSKHSCPCCRQTVEGFSRIFIP